VRREQGDEAMMVLEGVEAKGLTTQTGASRANCTDLTPASAKLMQSMCGCGCSVGGSGVESVRAPDITRRLTTPQ
jgi:hypothetical protein